MSQMAALEQAGLAVPNVGLGDLTTYKFGGAAAWLVQADTASQLEDAVGAAIGDGVPWMVLGRGSNVIISDSGFPGLVVRLGRDFSLVEINDDGTVVAGGAVALPKLARTCAKAGRGGLEFLVAVPGSVGGAVRMNAGCHGSDTGEWLQSVRVFRPGVGLVEVAREEMEMSYRANSLPESDIVVSAAFATVPCDPGESNEKMRAITHWRKVNQPGGTFNAGSVFKNPPGSAAGAIIDSVGLKGHTVGGARVSPRHANFFEASPKATAQDVHDLVAEVREKVAVATGIHLEPEVRFIGAFGDGESTPTTREDEIL